LTLDSSIAGFYIPLRELYKQGHSHKREIVVRGPVLDARALAVHEASGVWDKIRALPTPKEDRIEKMRRTDSNLPAGTLGVVKIPGGSNKASEPGSIGPDGRIAAKDLPNDPKEFMKKYSGANNPNRRTTHGRLPYALLKPDKSNPEVKKQRPKPLNRTQSVQSRYRDEKEKTSKTIKPRDLDFHTGKYAQYRT